MTNKKISLSLLNSLLLIIFIVLVTLAILISTYVNTQKVIDKNIEDYFNQTFNLTKLVLENEQKFLENISNEVAVSLYENGKLKKFEELYNSIDKSESLNDVDLLYIKTKQNDGYDYSSSLFDTQKIIEKIEEIKFTKDSLLTSLDVDKEKIILMLKVKKIVDSETGRVEALLYAGKIFNDNFTLLNSVKEKARLKNVHMIFENISIASTNQENSVELSKLKNSAITNIGKTLYSKSEIELYNGKEICFIFESENSVFDILKDSFIQQSLLLLLFVIVSFLILYFLSSKYIIKPISNLMEYAHKLKNHENAQYTITNVSEFDSFSVELKNIITELRDVKEQYSRAIDGVQDALWDLDLKKKTIFYSPRFMTMLGYEADEKLNYTSFWQRNIHKEDYEDTIKKLRDHLKNKTDIFEKEYRFRKKDGSYIWIKIRGKIFYDENGKFSRMTGFHTDINDLKSLQKENNKKEQMLYQQSKLASMGEMIGNIAHQWRQPLTVISVTASSINLDLELGMLEEKSTGKNVKKIMDTTEYLSSIIEKFRHFFNPNNKKEEFFVDELIKENMAIFESSYKSNGIDLIYDLDNVKVTGFKFELMQVIINIINNSKDALLSSEQKPEKKYIFITTIVYQETISIVIYDNAGGIPEKLKNKIYEPYFTTKHQSQGTGLGLYMSNEIIQKHFDGSLTNKTVEYTHEGENLKGEEFVIKIPYE